MSRPAHVAGWAVVILALLASLALLFYDQTSVHQALLATEIRLDNAEFQRDLYKDQLRDCQRQMTDQEDSSR